MRGASDDVFGAFSLETFADASSLSYTHEDAQGWYDYLAKFDTGNFWYRDANVKPWAYYEEYDNWDDTYGIDAVLAVYHSGHGTMDSKGVFWAPPGANWGGLGTWAHSDLMRIGNEQANYIFWSTCLSCRVLDGHSPSRTWQAANLGFRMLFGFETVRVDNPNYGRFFWEEWNKGKSLSTAWMDASWRIAHDQAPSVVASGVNQAKASDRLFNERTLEWPHVSNSWYWWRWHDAARSVNTPSRRPNLRIPSQAGSIRFARAMLSGDRLRSIVNGIGLPIRIPRAVTATKGGVSIREGEATVAMSMDGTFSARLTEPNRLEFNDGLLVPPGHFPMATPPSVIRNVALNRAPLRGTVRVAVILVDFSDRQFEAQHTATHFEQLFFSQGTVPTGSVREYFQDVNDGLIDIQGQVVGPLRLGRSLTQYANGASGTGDVRPNAGTMARDTALAADPEINFAPIDNDGDGFVDAFVIVHAGPGAEETGNPDHIWSHKWVLDGGELLIDATRLFAYLTVPEDARIGVCCHQLGHLLFGFPDLYDTDGSSSGVGNWCLMGVMSPRDWTILETLPEYDSILKQEISGKGDAWFRYN